MKQKNKSLILVALLIGCLIQTVVVLGQDWPRWRGPEANGISRESDWNPSVLTDYDRVVWERNIGRGHSAVSIVDGKLYTMGLRQIPQPTDTLYEEIVFCLDAVTGEEVWRYGYASAYEAWPGAGATPTVDNDRLYTLGRNGELYCFNADNGGVLWFRNLVDDSLSVKPDWGFCASPLATKNLLLLNVAQSGIALNKLTGELVWKSPKAKGGLATPVLFEKQGKQYAAINTDDILHAVDIENGNVIWTHPWETHNDPIVINNKLFLTAWRGGCCLLDVSGDQPKVEWHQRRMRCSYWQNYVVVNDHGFGIGREGQKSVYQCIDLKTGDVKWSEDLGELGSLMAAAGKLIILNGNGNLILANAVPDGFQEIVNARVFRLRHWRTYPNNDPHACWTAPVLSNGCIYSRTTWGDLICVNVSGSGGIFTSRRTD